MITKSKRNFMFREILILTCMEAHMALQKLTTTKVMMVSHCSFVKADIPTVPPRCSKCCKEGD